MTRMLEPAQTVLIACCVALPACSVDGRVFPEQPGAGGSPSALDVSPLVPGNPMGGTAGAPEDTVGMAASAVEQPGPVALASPGKLDLLFMIDNSQSMTDKQDILRLTLPDLMARLLNPICVDAEGNERLAPPPGADCPAGQRRQFQPLTDVNVGIVTSSLGDMQAEAACSSQPSNPRFVPDRNDRAHLLGSLVRSSAATNAHGFLEWRAGTSALADFNQAVQTMVADVRESGCGWEASLESWYRFLIDPQPYRELVSVRCPDGAEGTLNCVQPAADPSGAVLLDDTLLAQRQAFLRDDSLVAIVMLSDENDCSAQASGRARLPFDIRSPLRMYRSSSVCASDANAKCCYSCGSQPPDGCSPDPVCGADAAAPVRLESELDGDGLRCFDQKRRFGESFLYPTRRYVNALTQPLICISEPDLSTAGCPAANLLPNPLFERGRPLSAVVLEGIVGVPWQAIAAQRDARGQPLPANVLRYQTSEELSAEGVWAQILGSPGVEWRARRGVVPEVMSSPAVPPALPQMMESPDFPRPGVEVGNPINGRDYDTAQSGSVGSQPNDLQYACIFPLLEPRDCSQLDPNEVDCDCFEPLQDRPLCEQTPGVSPPGSTQYWAKAYPGLRQLAVLQELGALTDNAVVASICARNTIDSARPDFGYRPAIAALLERIEALLAAP